MVNRMCDFTEIFKVDRFCFADDFINSKFQSSYFSFPKIILKNSELLQYMIFQGQSFQNGFQFFLNFSESIDLLLLIIISILNFHLASTVFEIMAKKAKYTAVDLQF